MWSRNGRELFFRGDDNRIMVASYTVKGDSFAADKPRVWSEQKLADFGLVGVQNYDLAPDGKRIAAIMPAEAAEARPAQNHVVFLMNFFDELRRRVHRGVCSVSPVVYWLFSRATHCDWLAVSFGRSRSRSVAAPSTPCSAARSSHARACR